MIPRVLLLTEERPDARALGGVPVHVAALASGAAPYATAHAASLRGDALLVESFGPRRPQAVLPLGPGREELEAALVATLAGLGVEVLHVHSPLLGPRAIARAARRTGARLALTLHDHALVCENYTLLEGGERYCGIPDDAARCDRCLARTLGRQAGSLLAHRSAMAELLAHVDTVIAPTGSALEHAARIHPRIRERARIVGWGVPPPSVRLRHSPSAGGPLRVAVVGVHASVKGARVLPDLVAACHGLNVEWHLFGATLGQSQRAVTRGGARVVRHGAYPREDLARRLDAAGCHLAVLPSVFAETFSLVLSEVTAAGLPVVASRIAALEERVVGEELGWTFDPFAPETLRAVLADLTTHPDRVDAVRARLSARSHRDEATMVNDHVALWTALAGTASPPFVSLDEPVRIFRAAQQEARPESRLEQIVAHVRSTDFYRDLPLRRLLPESLRKRAESTVARLVRLARLARARTETRRR